MNDPTFGEGDRGSPLARRVYHAPGVLETSDFETLALSCGKATQGECDPYGVDPGNLSAS